MKLTGKTIMHFYLWLDENKISQIFFESLPEPCQNAFILQFFQYRQIWERIFYVEYRKTAFMDSKHATNEAIKEANEIYNKLP